MGVTGGKQFWAAVRGELKKVSDASDLWQIVEDAKPVVDEGDKEFIAAALNCIPEGDFTLKTWSEWIASAILIIYSSP